MDNISNINNKKKEIFPMIISDNSAMRNFRKKEDSRKSSGISLSDNYSLSSSSKGIKHYNFNKTPPRILVESRRILLSWGLGPNAMKLIESTSGSQFICAAIW